MGFILIPAGRIDGNNAVRSFGGFGRWRAERIQVVPAAVRLPETLPFHPKEPAGKRRPARHSKPDGTNVQPSVWVRGEEGVKEDEEE